MEATSSAAIARQTWELENNIPSAASDPGAMDAIYQYDEASQAKAQQEKPWANDPHHFRRAKISALALLKMVVHARAGGTIEVMGLMQGKCEGDAIIVMDAFALPVEGTETRVNAQADAYEYMVEYSTINKQILQGLFPAGKVEIGAFRTYPKDYKPPDEPVSEYQTIPLNKIEDFGVHCKQYYSLDITYFKSSLDSHLLDLLWNKYWVKHIVFITTSGQQGLSDKLEQAEGQLAHSRFGGMIMPSQRKKEQEESPLAKVTRDSSKITAEQVHGLMSQVIKDILFNSVHPSSKTSTDSSGPEPMVES
ncbi:hypothetical protein PR202_ga18759 [Eleusine coracana subsp. coracana]|uniref:COP9 signalosome complex subunit 5 n=1 Tax=Eleusine coracana subsp. coracana TaxID=191504 RepID=A0AAV5CTT2_ELECO|nr:hypothetical protein PR202_ga18759 [Eleusine coracana subsp. coracana]